MNQDSIRLEEREGQGRPYISRAARDLNRAGSRDLVRVYPVKQVERIS